MPVGRTQRAIDTRNAFPSFDIYNQRVRVVFLIDLTRLLSARPMLPPVEAPRGAHRVPLPPAREKKSRLLENAQSKSE